MRRNRILWLIPVLGLVALPPLTGGSHLLSIAVFTLLYAYLALSWNIIGGIAGQLSLGHAAWFGIGGYTSTLLFNHLGISPWLGMVFGALLSAGVAALIGLPSLRLRGAYFALATVATVLIMQIIVENSHGLLGGPRGLNIALLRHAPSKFQFSSTAYYYVVMVVFVAVAVLANHLILRSRLGYYLTAIRNDEESARALGVDTTRFKLLALMISAAMTAIGGTFYAQYGLYINPEKVFGVPLSVQIAVVCIIGGRGTVLGPLLGALLLVPTEELARQITGGLVGADVLVYGAVLMAVIYFEPRGFQVILLNAYRRLRTLVRGRPQVGGTTR